MPETACNIFMAKDPNDAIKDFLGEFGNESETNIFEETPENPFEEPSSEIVHEEPKEEKIPFNKDPKIQKYLDKEIDKLRKEFAQKPIVEEPKNTDTIDVISSFETIIGNDTPEKVAALKSLERALNNVDQRASEKAIAKLDELRLEELNADREAERELSDALDSIEETYSVDITSNNTLARKNRTEFIAYVEKIAPKNRNGDVVAYPDMISAWEEFSEKKKANVQPNRAKELANRGMTRSSEVNITEPQKRVTFDDFDTYVENFK